MIERHMWIALITFISLLLTSCKSQGTGDKMKSTSYAIVKALSEHDSSALAKLFVYDPAIEAHEIEHRKGNIEDGYKLCVTFSPVDTSQFKIRIEPISKTIYEAIVDVPFINKTGETRGKVTLHFDNWWGFTRAANIDLINFDEIDKAYHEPVYDHISDSLSMEGAKIIMKANHIPFRAH